MIEAAPSATGLVSAIDTGNPKNGLRTFYLKLTFFG